MTHRTHTACLPRLSYYSAGEVCIAPPVNGYNDLYATFSAWRMLPLCIYTKL